MSFCGQATSKSWARFSTRNLRVPKYLLIAHWILLSKWQFHYSLTPLSELLWSCPSSSAQLSTVFCHQLWQHTPISQFRHGSDATWSQVPLRIKQWRTQSLLSPWNSFLNSWARASTILFQAERKCLTKQAKLSLIKEKSLLIPITKSTKHPNKW